MSTDAANLSRLERLIAQARDLLANVRQGRADLERRRELAKGDPELIAQIDGLISRSGYVESLVSTAESGLSRVQAAMQGIGEWWDDTFGSGLGNLGIAPIIAIPAAIAAATVAISAATKWITDYRAAARRLDFIEARLAEGSDLEDAQRAADGAGSGFGEWATVAKLGIGASVLFGVAKLVESIK